MRKVVHNSPSQREKEEMRLRNMLKHEYKNLARDIMLWMQEGVKDIAGIISRYETCMSVSLTKKMKAYVESNVGLHKKEYLKPGDAPQLVALICGLRACASLNTPSREDVGLIYEAIKEVKHDKK